MAAPAPHRRRCARRLGWGANGRIRRRIDRHAGLAIFAYLCLPVSRGFAIDPDVVITLDAPISSLGADDPTAVAEVDVALAVDLAALCGLGIGRGLRADRPTGRGIFVGTPALVEIGAREGGTTRKQERSESRRQREGHAGVVSFRAERCHG